MCIGFGIVGHGFMGHEHEKMLISMEGIKVIGICDIAEIQLSDVKEGILRYRNAEDLFRNPDIQVVIIVVNNNQHKKLVMEAVKAGKDVICEKPVAMSVAELDEMTREVEKYGVKFTVHQQRRFDQDFRIVKEIYDRRMVGTPYVIKSSLYGYNGNMHDWHVFASEGGGMLYDWGVHLIDQMLWMIKGKVTSVYADVRNVINKEVDDYFNIFLKFDNGIGAEIELGTYYLTDKDHWFERHWFIGGDRGSAYIDGFEPTGKIVRTAHLLQNVSGQRTMTEAGPTRSFGPPNEGLLITEELPKVETSHEDYFRNYIRAYAGEEEFLVKIPETRRVLHLMEAIRESARDGKSIAFE
jgi:predicted dehydrogenase